MSSTDVLGQDLANIKNTKKEISISGNLGVSTVFYNVKGIDPRRPSFSYVFNTSPTLHLLGIDLPFSLLLSNYQRSYRQPFNQFGLSPYYKSVKLHLGYRSLNFSPYTLAGHRILGAGFEFNPGKLRLGFMYGRFNKAIERDTTLTPQNDLSRPVRSSFSRKGFAAKIGVGSDRNFFDLIVLKAKDDPSSIEVLNISTALHPEENLVFGIANQFYIAKNLSFKLNAGASAYSKDINAEGVDIDTTSLNKVMFALFSPRLSTKVSFAGETKLEYKTKKFSTEILYKRIDPGYQSMGTYYFQNDVVQYRLGLSFAALKSTMRCSASFGLQSDNVRENRASNTARKIGNFALSYQPNQQFGIDLQYANFGVTQNPLQKSISDTTLLRNITQSFMLAPRYTITGDNINHNFNVIVNFQNLNDKNSFTAGFTEMKSLSTNFSYMATMMKLGLNVRSSLLFNNNELSVGKTNSFGGSVGFGKMFLDKKLVTGLNYTYSTNSFNGDSNGHTSRMNVNITGKINKSQSLRLTAFILKNATEINQVGNDFSETTVRLDYNIRFNTQKKK
jgi:hypothetical protein